MTMLAQKKRDSQRKPESDAPKLKSDVIKSKNGYVWPAQRKEKKPKPAPVPIPQPAPIVPQPTPSPVSVTALVKPVIVRESPIKWLKVPTTAINTGKGTTWNDKIWEKTYHSVLDSGYKLHSCSLSSGYILVTFVRA